MTSCNSVQQGAKTVHVNLQGRAMGGEQPITDATIQLYAVGVGTDGGTSTALINQTTTPVTTSDGTGAANSNANPGNANNTLAAGYFNITGDYTCPSASTLVYLAAIGGNPGVGANNAQEQIVALGQCGNLTSSTYVTVNEITTVGTVRALSGYITAYDAVGSTVAHESALATAFNTVNQYVNTINGTVPGPSLPAGYDADAYDVNALANVVQNCVNTNGSTANGSVCGTFFGYAQGTAASAPTDTVTALIDIFNDPTNNVTNIFNAQGTTPAFAPVYSSAPTDWSLPIRALPSAPTFSPAGASYAAAQTVTISDSDATATIYYTTNGATPTSSSTVYSGPISVATSETVNAIAVDANGRLTGPEGSATYSGALTPVAQTGSLSAVSTTFGSTGPVTLTATSNANGGIVTFGTAGSVGGSYSPTTCTIANGSCSVSYVPSGSLAAGTYTNDLTASFGPYSSYTPTTGSGTLTINAAPTFTNTVLVSFTDRSGPDYGAAPGYANPVQGSDGNFYGMTYEGGTTNYGEIYRINSSGAYTALAHFASTTGQYPEGSLVEGSDGVFYGMTSAGGMSSDGTIFKVSPVSPYTLTVMHQFGGTADGRAPFGNLVQGSDGNFYGMTFSGGAGNEGVVFKISPTSPYTFTLMHSFASGTGDGENPYGSLVQGSDGNFYGTTNAGGASTYGTVFEISATYPYTVTLLHSFNGTSTDGKGAFTTLIAGPNGNFYGMAGGGASGHGIVFQISATGTGFSQVHNFTGSPTDGSGPQGPVVLGSDGNFYGMTTAGGVDNDGAAFQVTPSGTSALLHSFTDTGTDGEIPGGGFVQGSDGSFYGFTSQGNSTGSQYGTIFKEVGSPALAGPVTLTVPASVTHATSFTLSYAVSNAYSTSGVTVVGNTTLQQCFATNNGGDTTGWIGAKTGAVDATNVTLTAPATAGTYTYTLTCGGIESGFATLTVQ